MGSCKQKLNQIYTLGILCTLSQHQWGFVGGILRSGRRLPMGTCAVPRVVWRALPPATFFRLVARCIRQPVLVPSLCSRAPVLYIVLCVEKITSLGTRTTPTPPNTYIGPALPATEPQPTLLLIHQSRWPAFTSPTPQAHTYNFLQLQLSSTESLYHSPSDHSSPHSFQNHLSATSKVT